jgi:hypothetical protein
MRSSTCFERAFMSRPDVSAIFDKGLGNFDMSASEAAKV